MHFLFIFLQEVLPRVNALLIDESSCLYKGGKDIGIALTDTLRLRN
jgi:hypothetical protein